VNAWRLPLSAALCVLTTTLFCALTAIADWSLFRGNPAMTGAVAHPLPHPLEERWQFRTGDAIEGAPAIVGQQVFVASLDKHLYALELPTGKLLWKTRLGPMKAAPTVHKNLVFIGDLEGTFYCLDATTGKIRWKYAADGEIHAAANIYNDHIIFGAHDSQLYCLNSEGKKIWGVSIDGPINAAAPIQDHWAFATGCSDGVVHIVDLRTGKEIGTISLGGETVSTPAIAGNRLIVTMISHQIVAADIQKRGKLWTFEPPRRAMPFYSSPAVAQNIVVAGSRDRKVYALDITTGKKLWDFATEGHVDASPVIAAGKVYVGCLSRDGHFYVLDLKTGQKLQEILLDAPVTSSAGIGPDCLCVGTDRGVLYCLGKK
jgi:outer membrane protein assembly factor BamB